MTPDLRSFSAPEDLTEAEAEVWIAVEEGDVGPREYARRSGRSPGTVSNLLRRARDKRGCPA